MLVLLPPAVNMRTSSTLGITITLEVTLSSNSGSLQMSPPPAFLKRTNPFSNIGCLQDPCTGPGAEDSMMSKRKSLFHGAYILGEMMESGKKIHATLGGNERNEVKKDKVIGNDRRW